MTRTFSPDADDPFQEVTLVERTNQIDRSTEDPAEESRPERASRQSPMGLRISASTGVWIGILVAGAGFAAIAVGWGAVAGETEVYRQLPYVVSAGLVGLGLIMVGLTIINLATLAADAADRDRRIDDLVATIAELTHSLSDDGGTT